MGFWPSLPRKKPARPPEPFNVEQIVFIGEQDGPPEQTLKSRLIQLFARADSVERAYLAKVQYENSSKIDVALCIRTKSPDQQLLREVGEVFAAIFKTDVHMDILFLTEDQVNRLQVVCKAFWP